MEQEWRSLDAEALRSLYQQKQQEFTTALLNGADWKEVQEQRKLVTELSIALYKRVNEQNPAENNTRHYSAHPDI
jgi:hypothetical protein